MDINNVSAVSATNNNKESQEEMQRATSLGKDDFFELLITQLKNQDPLDPMKNEDFIAQMAQFSSLEQMYNMNQSMGEFLKVQTLSEGATLVGKTVETVNPDDGKIISGKVEKVSFEDDMSFIHLDNGMKVSIDEIRSVIS